MSYNAKDLFPDWYVTVDLNMDDKVIEKRLKAIRKIILNKDNKDFWLDMVRLYLGIKPKDSNRKEFVDEFKSEDSTFLLLNNDNIIKCLAAILLCFKIEKGRSDLNSLISLAVVNANFFGQFQVFENIDVLEYAEKYLSSYSSDEISTKHVISELEEIKLKFETETETEENTEETEEEEIILDNEDHLKIINIIEKLIKSNAKLAEETNVLWWIYGESSKLANDFFIKVGIQTMSLIAARELSDIIQAPIGATSANQLLDKVLLISNGNKVTMKKVSIPEVLENVSEDMKEKVLRGKKGILSELTPCLMAVCSSSGCAVGEDWIGKFKKSYYNPDIDKKLELSELSYQFYREYVFLKLLK